MLTKQQIVDNWNTKVPIGTEVTYYPTPGREENFNAHTSSQAQLLGGHTPVVWLEGRVGCVALSHLLVPIRPKKCDGCWKLLEDPKNPGDTWTELVPINAEAQVATRRYCWECAYEAMRAMRVEAIKRVKQYDTRRAEALLEDLKTRVWYTSDEKEHDYS